MPPSHSPAPQALAFLSGANSIFDGDKLLTTANNDRNEDQVRRGQGAAGAHWEEGAGVARRQGFKVHEKGAGLLAPGAAAAKGRSLRARAPLRLHCWR